MNRERCPICGRASMKLLVERGKGWVICRCSHCQGDFAQPAPSLDSVDYHRLYEAGGSITLDAYKLAAVSNPKEQLRDARKLFANFRHALKFLGALQGKLLDVGCGIGVFPKLAEELGVEVYALDPAEEAIRYAKESFGLKGVLVGTINNVPPTWQNFDVITCFEVLEHVWEPNELVKKIYKLLKPGGYFIMSVPNRNRLAVKLRRRDCWDRPPSPLPRWSKQVLEFFLADLGFINVMVKIDGINRRDVSNILLPSKVNHTIIRRKLTVLTVPEQTQRGSFLHSPIWKFTQRTADFVALVLQTMVGNLYGRYLIAFAQKPHGRSSS